MIKVYVQKFGDLNIRFEQAKVVQQGGQPGDDSGFDLMAAMDCEREVPPMGRWVVPTSIFIAMPRGVEAQVRPRSGLARDFGFGPICIGTIDASYRGEIKVTCFNLGSQPYKIVPGERIAQLVFAPVLPWGAELTKYDCEIGFVTELKKLGDTPRGTSGYGSSGR